MRHTENDMDRTATVGSYVNDFATNTAINVDLGICVIHVRNGDGFVAIFGAEIANYDDLLSDDRGHHLVILSESSFERSESCTTTRFNCIPWQFIFMGVYVRVTTFLHSL